MKNEGLGTQRLAELSGGSFGSPFISPDLTKAAIIKKTSIPLSGRPGEHSMPSVYFLIIYEYVPADRSLKLKPILDIGLLSLRLPRSFGSGTAQSCWFGGRTVGE